MKAMTTMIAALAMLAFAAAADARPWHGGGGPKMRGPDGPNPPPCAAAEEDDNAGRPCCGACDGDGPRAGCCGDGPHGRRWADDEGERPRMRMRDGMGPHGKRRADDNGNGPPPGPRRGMCDGPRGPRGGMRGEFPPGMRGRGEGPCMPAGDDEPLSLNEADVGAVRRALLDELGMEIYYGQVIEQFDEPRGVGRLHQAEGRHAAALRNLLERAEVDPPAPEEAAVPELPATLAGALQLALDHERTNVALYDELLPAVTDGTVKRVFEALREASSERHTKALERQLKKIGE
ncbi:MAG: hypothetical protein J5J06_11830 [Phycisphaerae bacterium]|nr:hypothetical protein [Phycisphaerae bacterium]